MNQIPITQPQAATPIVPNPILNTALPTQVVAQVSGVTPAPQLNTQPQIQPSAQNTTPDNLNTSSTSETPSTDLTPHKKKILMIAGSIVLFLVLAAGGVFAYQQYSSTKTISLEDSHIAPPVSEENIINSNSKEKPDDLPIASPDPNLNVLNNDSDKEQTIPIRKENIVNMEASLQNFLQKNCQEIDKIDYQFGLKLSQIPLTFDKTIHGITNNQGKEAICTSSAPNEIKNGIVSLGSNTLNYLIYDDNSEPLGGGGPPTIGEFGEEIFLENNLRITAFLSRSHGGPMTTSDAYLNLRAIKNFKTLSGEEFYVVATKMVIEKGNPNLLSILNQFSKTDEKIIDQEFLNKEPEIIDKIVEEMSLLKKSNVLQLINQFKIINPSRF